MKSTSKKGVFVGYIPNSQAWMVYYPASRTVISSRSVTFDEEWRPVSPLRALNSAPQSSPTAGAVPVDPFLYKAPVTDPIPVSVSLPPAAHPGTSPAEPPLSISVLPPRLAAPSVAPPSRNFTDDARAVQLPYVGTTR